MARRVWALILRARFPLLVVWMLPWFVHATHTRAGGLTDWVWFEVGARILAHHNTVESSGPLLHMYANHPVMQIGPPALLLVAPLQWLSPDVVSTIAAAAMSLAVVPCLYALERTVAPRDVRGRILLAGLFVAPIWTWESVYWRHLDDVVVLLLVALALPLVRRGDHELLTGLLLGSAIATKPWAALLLPVIVGYSRARRPVVVLATLAVGAIWWLPFLVAAPQTLQAMADFAIPSQTGSLWHGLGFAFAPSYARVLQLGGGLVIGALVGRRRGWLAVPVVAMAWRVTVDPFSWPYYVMGPLVFGLLWDLTRDGRRLPSVLLPATWAARLPTIWVPWATLTAIVVEIGMRHAYHPAQPFVRVAWCLGILVAAAIGVRGAADQIPLDERAEPLLTATA